MFALVGNRFCSFFSIIFSAIISAVQKIHCSNGKKKCQDFLDELYLLTSPHISSNIFL
jgi:hypothetical protein